MTPLLGEYDCKIDSKGRVRLPSNLILQLGKSVSVPFVINRGFGKYLNIYPKVSWDYYAAKVNRKSTFKKENLMFMRYFYRGATEVSVDGSERILLSKRLIEYAEIEKEVILNALNDRIEVWSPHNFDIQLEGEPTVDYLRLAEQIFPDDNNDDKPGF